jgi:hypothetical protein
VTPNSENYNPDPQYMRELVLSVPLTRGKLAKLLGIDVRTLRRYLSGERPYTYIFQFAMESLVLN